MKRKMSYRGGVLLLASVIIFSCCQKPVEPIVTPPVVIPSDLDATNIQFFPYGGDPRGTYYPNKPVVLVTGFQISALETVAPTINEGSGKLIIEGSSATTGTWRTENFTMQFDGKLKLNGSLYPISTVNHDTLAAFFNYGIGRWTISRNYSAQIFFSNRTDVFDVVFTADSLGMYFYTSPPRISYPPDANTILCTTIFKKQR